MILFLAALTIAIIILVIQVLILLFSPGKELFRSPSHRYLFVSVLVAARNEEEHLKECLEKLLDQTYPSGKYEILVGNDNSTDSTAQITEAFNHQSIQLINIPDIDSDMPPKARVISNLLKKAVGEYILITDADVVVPNTWIENHLDLARPDFGTISGFTGIKSVNVFTSLLNQEWLSVLLKIKILCDFGISITALGNNMAFSKKSLNEIGGFNSLNFNSINEDQIIALNFQKKGYKNGFDNSSYTFAETYHPKTINRLLNQRKRWMTGLKLLPVWLIVIQVFEILFIPAAVFLLFVNATLGGILLLAKIVISMSIQIRISNRLGNKIKLLPLLLFDFYYFAINFTSIFYYFLPTNFHWKGRKL